MSRDTQDPTWGIPHRAPVACSLRRMAQPLSTGDRVKQRRLELGLSQHALGVAAGVREQTIGRIERDCPTSVSTLVAVARALECSAGELLD